MPQLPAVLVCRRLLPAGLGLLTDAGHQIREGGLEVTAEELLELAPGCAAIVADPSVPVERALLDAAGPELRVVANFAVGYDNVNLQACRERGIAVTNTPGVLTNATAELALELTLAAARRASEAEADLRAGRWSGWDPAAYLGLELSGTPIGIVGLGRIGRRYAELAHAFAGEILYLARSPKPEAEASLGARQVELPELLERSDVVSLHAPSTADTHKMIGSAELAAMQAHAVLVNTSRGPLVDSISLARALNEGEIGAAGLDVYEDEPQVPDELLAAPRCVLLPHIGSATRTAREGMATLAARNVLAVLAGGEPLNPVI